MKIGWMVLMVGVLLASAACGDNESEKTQPAESSSPTSPPASGGDACAKYLARVCSVCGDTAESCVNLGASMKSGKLKRTFTTAACTGQMMAFDNAIGKSPATKEGMCKRAPGAAPPELLENLP